MKDKKIIINWGEQLIEEINGDYGQKSKQEKPPAEEIIKIFEELSASFEIYILTKNRKPVPSYIKKTLDRIGIGEFIDDIKNVGREQNINQDIQFFRKLEEELNDRPDNLVLISEDFEDDIMGACQAGWQTVWFNPKNKLAPGVMAVQNAEFASLLQLNQMMDVEFLPGYQTIQNWYQEKNRSLRLWMHVQLVAGVAYILANLMKEKGMDVDPILAQRGGLLHDICKLDKRNMVFPKDHGQMGYAWLKKRNQPILAKISEKHILNAILYPKRRPETWEEKIVYFADKISEESTLVNLNTRIERLKRRYPTHSKSIEESINSMNALQNEITEVLGLTEDELLAEIRKRMSQTE